MVGIQRNRKMSWKVNIRSYELESNLFSMHVCNPDYVILPGTAIFAFIPGCLSLFSVILG